MLNPAQKVLQQKYPLSTLEIQMKEPPNLSEVVRKIFPEEIKFELGIKMRFVGVFWAEK